MLIAGLPIPAPAPTPAPALASKAAATSAAAAARRGTTDRGDAGRGGEESTRPRTSKARSAPQPDSTSSILAAIAARRAPATATAARASIGRGAQVEATAAMPAGGRAVGAAAKALSKAAGGGVGSSVGKGGTDWTMEEIRELHRVRLEISPEHRQFWEQDR